MRGIGPSDASESTRRRNELPVQVESSSRFLIMYVV